MNLNLNFRLIMLKLIFILIILPYLSGESNRFYNSECGESPTQKYKDLAKAIGKLV